MFWILGCDAGWVGVGGISLHLDFCGIHLFRGGFLRVWDLFDFVFFTWMCFVSFGYFLVAELLDLLVWDLICDVGLVDGFRV